MKRRTTSDRASDDDDGEISERDTAVAGGTVKKRRIPSRPKLRSENETKVSQRLHVDYDLDSNDDDDDDDDDDDTDGDDDSRTEDGSEGDVEIVVDETTASRGDDRLKQRRRDRAEVLDLKFESAEDSTSVYRTVEETDRALRGMVVRSDRMNDVPRRELNVLFYSRLLPVFVKTHLLLVDLISIPAEFSHTVLKGQGVRYLFTFENVRVFNLDNATLLLDHRYVKTSTGLRDFVMKVVGRPVNTRLATFPKTITADTNVFTGTGKDDDDDGGGGEINVRRSAPSRHFVGSYVLRQNFTLTRPASSSSLPLLEHQFSEGEPPSFWWDAYDTAVPEDGDFLLRINEAVQDRPVIVDFLFLLGNVDGKTGTVNRVHGSAKWAAAVGRGDRSGGDSSADEAAVTVHTLLCFGFRVLSFGMLCEYTKTCTADWIKRGPIGGGSGAYAARRRILTNEYRFAPPNTGADAAVTNNKTKMTRQAVMRMTYTLDSTDSMNKFFRIMDTHEQTMKSRVVRSRLFYKTAIRWDLVGGCYAYPNNSLYMVLGSCNMLYTTREMSVCTLSVTAGALGRLTDKPRNDFDDVEKKKVRNKKPTRVLATAVAARHDRTLPTPTDGIEIRTKEVAPSSSPAYKRKLNAEQTPAVDGLRWTSLTKKVKSVTPHDEVRAKRKTLSVPPVPKKVKSITPRDDDVRAKRKPLSISPAPVSAAASSSSSK